MIRTRSHPSNQGWSHGWHTGWPGGHLHHLQHPPPCPRHLRDALLPNLQQRHDHVQWVESCCCQADEPSSVRLTYSQYLCLLLSGSPFPLLPFNYNEEQFMFCFLRTKCFGLCSSAKGLKFLEMQLSPNSKTVKQGRTCTELSCSSCFRKNLKTILYCHNHCPIDSLSVLERYIFTRGWQESLTWTG